MTARILSVEDGDSEYDHAFQLARQSFARLDDLWNAPFEGQRNYMIKVCFQGTRRPIFLWLELISIQADSYVAEVFESTDELPSIAEGQEFKVPKNLALDWLVNDDGVIHGGFTLLVERRRLSGADLAEFDEMLMAKEWLDA